MEQIFKVSLFNDFIFLKRFYLEPLLKYKPPEGQTKGFH